MLIHRPALAGSSPAVSLSLAGKSRKVKSSMLFERPFPAFLADLRHVGVGEIFLQHYAALEFQSSHSTEATGLNFRLP